MRIYQQGFVLITVLIFLAALSLLVLAIVEITQLETRMSQNVVARLNEFSAVDTALQQLEQTLATDKQTICEANCWIRIANFNIAYRIEKIPGTACVAAPNAQFFMGAYYRITAWYTAENYPPLQLQSTYLVATSQICMHEQPHGFPVLHAGSLSWRDY